MKPGVKIGTVIGTAAAVNVECGFVPAAVLLTQSDGLLFTFARLSWVMPFSSGGTAIILPGATIRGATSRATATVREVLTSATTWAAGTAAGWLVLEEGSLVGTFGSENIVITNLASGVIGTDDATVTVNVVHNVAFAAAAAPATGNAAISRYEGVAASNAKGFTIGSTLSATGQLLTYMAFREDI
jgi:hypothetical protein